MEQELLDDEQRATRDDVNDDEQVAATAME